METGCLEKNDIRISCLIMRLQNNISLYIVQIYVVYVAKVELLDIIYVLNCQ